MKLLDIWVSLSNHNHVMYEMRADLVVETENRGNVIARDLQPADQISDGWLIIATNRGDVLVTRPKY